ncbi:MAG TPA: large conductance mechanosensitive channel protein MscL [Ktedonobacteraceae bacterium]|nr:large conductance mechanosensitive channel protein MscL [Ktedonobacteraceae bacterium]
MAFWDNSNVQKAEKATVGVLSGFKAFILRGNVVDLAIGIMIGAAFSGVVNSLVSDIITPLIPAVGKGLSDASTTVYTGGTLRYGHFINTVLSFLILALVIYFFIVRPVNALMDRFKPRPAATPTTRECPYCLSTIPLKATRCAYCTAQLPPAGEPSPARAQGA